MYNFRLDFLICLLGQAYISDTLKSIRCKQLELENRINDLLENSQLYIRQITEAMLDNIVDETQEKMVEYSVKGYQYFKIGLYLNFVKHA